MRMQERTLLRKLLLFADIISTSYLLDLNRCDTPLGMQSGAIPDQAISASSSFDPTRVGPRSSRLNVELEGGAWCPGRAVESGVIEYLQVNLSGPVWLSAVSIQGRFGNGRGVEFAEHFRLQYWRYPLTSWKEYRSWNGTEILLGNTNSYLPVKRSLLPPVAAQVVRIIPRSVLRRTVCLRVELHGCNKTDGLLSYSAPVSSLATQTDSSYDGHIAGGRGHGGLGKLTDGVGRSVARPQGFEWVAWNNASSRDGFLEIRFFYEDLRNFTSLTLGCKALCSKKIQLGASVKGSYCTSEESHQLHRMTATENTFVAHFSPTIAKTICLRVFFTQSWLLISEVAFYSEPVSATDLSLWNSSYTTADASEASVTVPRSALQYVVTTVTVCALAILALVAAIVRHHRTRQHSLGTAGCYARGDTKFCNQSGKEDVLQTAFKRSMSFAMITEKHGVPFIQELIRDSSAMEYAEPLMAQPAACSTVSRSRRCCDSWRGTSSVSTPLAAAAAAEQLDACETAAARVCCGAQAAPTPATDSRCSLPVPCQLRPLHTHRHTARSKSMISQYDKRGHLAGYKSVLLKDKSDAQCYMLSDKPNHCDLDKLYTSRGANGRKSMSDHRNCCRNSHVNDPAMARNKMEQHYAAADVCWTADSN